MASSLLVVVLMNVSGPLLCSFLFACSSIRAGQPDAAIAPDTPPDSPQDAELGCIATPSVPRADLVQASVAYLRSAFGVADGFDQGDVRYGEMWVSLGDGSCPYADWTALGYFAAIDSSHVPAELAGEVASVAVMWALNGRKFVVYVTSAPDGSQQIWQAGRLPDSISAVPAAGARQADIDALIAHLHADHPELMVTWLDAVRILTIDGVVGDFAGDLPPATFNTVPQIEAAVQQVRASGLFSSIEWSGLVFNIPNWGWPMNHVDASILRPECMRQESRSLLETGQFTTSPSFAAPLGAGPAPHQAVCP